MAGAAGGFCATAVSVYTVFKVVSKSFLCFAGSYRRAYRAVHCLMQPFVRGSKQ